MVVLWSDLPPKAKLSKNFRQSVLCRRRVLPCLRGEVQEGKSPSSLLFQPISPSSLLFGAISPSSLNLDQKLVGATQNSCTPALSRKVSFLTFGASPLHQHTAQKLCNHRMSCKLDFCGKKSPVGYSREFLVGLCRRISKFWPYFRPNNVVIYTCFQTWPLRNSVIITVMIWFSAFLPRSAPLRVSFR